MEKMTRAATTRDSEKYIVRFPDGMRDRIAEVAKANGRSMNAEIVSRLDQTFTITHGSFTGASGETSNLREVADAHKEATKRLGQLNYALALALEELASYVPEEMLRPGGAAEKSVRMARALARNEQVTIYKNTIVASAYGSDSVTHLDLEQNIAQLERLAPTKPTA